MNNIEENVIEEKIIQTLSQLTNHPKEIIKLSTHLYNELHVDSLQFLILLDQIELEFGISIDFNDFDQSFFETPEMIVTYVQRRINHE